MSYFTYLFPADLRLNDQNKYRMDLDQLRKDIRTQGIEVVLASNPRNPTGQVCQREELKELVELSRESSTTLILDEVRAYLLAGVLSFSADYSG